MNLSSDAPPRTRRKSFSNPGVGATGLSTNGQMRIDSRTLVALGHAFERNRKNGLSNRTLGGRDLVSLCGSSRQALPLWSLPLRPQHGWKWRCVSRHLCARISLMRFLLALVLLAVNGAGQLLTAIKCGRLFDGRTLALQTDVVVLVDGNRIVSVGKEAIPQNARVIDLSQATVMPGLVDSHTHMFLHGIPYDDAILRKSLQYRAILATVAARKTLLAGFTSIRDLETEGAWYGDAALRCHQ